MFNINNNEINIVNNILKNEPCTNIHWLQQTCVENNFELSDHYAHICQQHKQEKKWVLFINPEESSIEKLAKTHGIDASKILMVKYKNAVPNHVEIELKRLTSVLSKGNCAAVILSNNVFTTEDITQIESAAAIGNTHCFLVKQRKLH